MTRELVLLNGWGMTQAVWEPLVAALPHVDGVQRMDLHELALPGNARVKDFARAAAERAPRRCDVVAWSLGAQIALQWAHDAPAQVGRLVLIAATPCFVARSDWATGMDVSVFEAFADEVDRDTSAALARFALLQARGDSNMTAVARLLRASVCRDADESRPALHAGLDCLRDTDLRAFVGTVTRPTCLIHGAHDALVPVAAAEYLGAAMPDARLRVMVSAGHAPHVSEPASVAASIAEFLDEQ
jgi:pimeloyl-[acyl-carrier protein] methyl ester esterase